MKAVETSRHLFQAPFYRDPKGTWTSDFTQALKNCDDDVHLDTAAIVSFLSFGMVGLDRTLLKEITRQPWMSKVVKADQVVKEPIPPHGFMTSPKHQIAKRLYQLLCNEARTVCEGFGEIYILLSGGLDSRIVAGILADLYHAGEITTKPKAVTWGLPDSRDVVYAKQIAKILDFEWQNIEFGPETILLNIGATVQQLGLLHSPEMLHNMLWFKNIPETSLVIAASFGDSIGRAEFAGLHLINQYRRKPENVLALLQPKVYKASSMELNSDLEEIYKRAEGDVPSYARYEHWMQGYRMRGGLCHALSIINSYATIYQMFTTPEVYEYMWSLHPACRDDSIYATMLENEFPKLARIPWARTNRALQGATIGAMPNLRPNYHETTKWSSGPLYAQLNRSIDPDWFDATGLFNPQSIRKINKMVRWSQVRFGRLNDIWLWMAGFRTFVEFVEQNGKKLIIPKEWPDTDIRNIPKPSVIKQYVFWWASKFQPVNSTLRKVRGYYRNMKLKNKKKDMLRKYPPIHNSNQEDA